MAYLLGKCKSSAVPCLSWDNRVKGFCPLGKKRSDYLVAFCSLFIAGFFGLKRKVTFLICPLPSWQKILKTSFKLSLLAIIASRTVSVHFHKSCGLPSEQILSVWKSVSLSQRSAITLFVQSPIGSKNQV